MDAPGNPAPPPATPPGDRPARAGIARQVLARLSRMWAAVASLVVLATIPIFISFSTTQIKELFDQFTGGCLLVLDKQATPDGRLFVTGRIAGTMPARMPLVFQARDSMINTIDFVDAYRHEKIPEPDDLSFHPMTYLGCPGPLCPDAGTDPRRGQVQVMLTDLRPEFTLRFNVRMIPNDPKANPVPANLKAYVAYDKGVEGAVCRVQPQRWFNFWVWATPVSKAAFFICIIVVGGLIVRWANRPKEARP